MKQYVKALDINSECFKYIPHASPGLSEENIKANIFNGPQIRQLLKDANFVSLMTLTSQQLSENFLETKKLKAIKSFYMNRCLVLKQFVVRAQNYTT